MDNCTVTRFYKKKSIEKISRSVRVHVYLVLTSQVQVSSSIVGNSAPAMDVKKFLRVRSRN